MRILVLLLCLLGTTAHAANPDDAFSGSWWGVLDAGAFKLHIVFKLRHENAAWSGDLASPDQGPGTLPINSVSIAGETIKLDMQSLHASYEGKRVDKDHIKGTFTQGAPLPLDLQRGELPIARRPQEPKPPFPYQSENVSVDNRAAALKLGCTLTHPKDAAKFPVVVMITGSGQQDRDETVMGHKPFWILADALARHGIGALRCDDRGKGESTGDFGKSTTFDFAGDVAAELAWLATRPDVDGRHLGLIGHSEGGVIAPIVASRGKDVAFLVLLAGTGQRGDEIIAEQQMLVAKAAGASDKDVAEGQALQKKILNVLVTEKDDAAARKKIKAIFDALPPEARKGPEFSDAAIDAQLNAMLSPWYRTFLRLDPKIYLQKVKVPVLALHGSRDVQVPAAANAAAIREALQGDADVTVKELPGLNHLFQNCKTCSVSEYQTLEETMSPSVLELVVDWVGKHAR